MFFPFIGRNVDLYSKNGDFFATHVIIISLVNLNYIKNIGDP